MHQQKLSLNGVSCPYSNIFKKVDCVQMTGKAPWKDVIMKNNLKNTVRCKRENVLPESMRSYLLYSEVHAKMKSDDNIRAHCIDTQ